MDPITHTCSGILLGQGLRPITAVRKIDAAGGGHWPRSPRISMPSVISGERTPFIVSITPTHIRLWGLVVVALVLAMIERRWLTNLSFARLLGINLGGGAIHLCGDMIALWPLHLLWPFNDHDFVLQWTSDFDYVVLAVVIVATGLSETDGFQDRAPWIIAGAVLLLVAYFLFIPGWGAA